MCRQSATRRGENKVNLMTGGWGKKKGCKVRSATREGGKGKELPMVEIVLS